MSNSSVPSGASEPVYKDADWCRARYFEDDLTLRDIAREAGCSLRTVARWFKTHEIEALATHVKREQRGNTVRGAQSPHWTGGHNCPSCGKPRSYRGTQVRLCQDCRTTAQQGEGNPRWLGDLVGYDAAHDRVKAAYGKAASHGCRHCSGTAAHWAYDHTDPNEKHDDPEEGPYSIDPTRYLPLCASCHKRFDDAHRKKSP